MAARGIRFEIVLGTVCAILWALVLALQTPFLSAAGLLDLSLYGLYSTGAALGWLAGNIFVARQRRLEGGTRGLLALYCLGPLAVVVLLRSFASQVQQDAAPLVPLYGVVVYWIFFLVPVSFRRAGR